MVVEVALAAGLGRRRLAAVDDAAERLAAWLGKRLELVTL